LIISFIIILFFAIFIFFKQNNINSKRIDEKPSKLSNTDISEPKFSINNDTQKIYITAKEGNFINKNEILLKKDVRFKSNDFSIETENVIFDRNNQTAKSKTKSLFKSKNTSITSDGFDINEKGNKIVFYGNSFVILK
tara:strand:+ start:1051 stop:1464 length:414 start_codon:yes stop_codon:yes gene_type:complete